MRKPARIGPPTAHRPSGDRRRRRPCPAVLREESWSGSLYPAGSGAHRGRPGRVARDERGPDRRQTAADQGDGEPGQADEDRRRLPYLSRGGRHDQQHAHRERGSRHRATGPALTRRAGRSRYWARRCSSSWHRQFPAGTTTGPRRYLHVGFADPATVRGSGRGWAASGCGGDQHGTASSAGGEQQDVVALSTVSFRPSAADMFVTDRVRGEHVGLGSTRVCSASTACGGGGMGRAEAFVPRACGLLAGGRVVRRARAQAGLACAAAVRPGFVQPLAARRSPRRASRLA